MSTRRLAVSALLAVVLFLGGSLWLVDRITRPPPGAPGAPAPVEPAPASSVTGPGSAPAGSDVPIALVAKDMKPIVIEAPKPPPPPPGSWEAVPVSARASALGPLGAAVGRELNELKPQIDACFDEDSQARHGTSAVSVVRDVAPQEDSGTTVLMLQLETSGQGVSIVDAPVETRGKASDGLLACVQGRLRGRYVPVEGTRAGKRYRMLYTVLP